MGLAPVIGARPGEERGSGGHLEPPDAELIRRCLRRDEEAWEQMVRRYSSLIYSVARRYGLKDSEAEDVFQSVCVALWEGLASLREASKLTSWLITVTARSAWHLINCRERLNTAPLEETLDYPDLEGEHPEEEVLRRERWESLRRGMARLPERCQRLLWYLFYDPAAPSYAEVARRLGVPEGSIGPTRGRCLEQLHVVLEALESPARAVSSAGRTPALR